MRSPMLVTRSLPVVALLCGCPAAAPHVLAGDTQQQQVATPKPNLPNPPVQPQPVPGAGCAQSPLWMVAGNTLRVVDGTGQARTLFTFAPELPAENVIVNVWHQVPGFMAAVAFLYDGENAHRYEFVVLRPDGTVVFHRVEQQPHNPDIFLSLDGTLAVSGDHSFVARTDGTLVELGEDRPVAPVHNGTHVLVARGRPWMPGTPHGWLSLGDRSFRPITTVAQGYSTVVHVNGNIFHQSYAEGATTPLVRTTPHADVAIAPERTAQAPVTLMSHAGNFLLFHRSPELPLLRVDATTGDALDVSVPPPARQIWGVWTSTVRADGTVQGMETLADGRLQLLRTADLGNSFEQVGQPMTPGPDFGLGSHLFSLSHGDSTLILNLSTGYGDFLQDVQLVAGNTTTHEPTGGFYVNANIFPGASDLSPDGSCAVTFAQREGTVFSEDATFELVFLDATTGTRSAFPWANPYGIQLAFVAR